LSVETLLDASKPEFLVDLLLFSNHPDFQNASQASQQAALSYGWLTYNEKTNTI